MLSVCTRRDCCSEDTGVASAESIDVGVCVGGGSTGDAGRGDSRCARDGQPTNASLALIVLVVQREFNTVISLHETSTLNVSSTARYVHVEREFNAVISLHETSMLL